MRFLLLGLALAATVGAAQAETAGAQIGGIVTSRSTGEPLKSVQAILRFPDDSGSPRRTEMTGPNGEFQFTHLPPGAYRLELRKAGYRPLRGAEGELFLDSGETAINRFFPLAPMASVAGRVVNPDGVAISRSEVRAYAMRYRSGRVRLAYAGRSSTDERGEYRLYGLGAGKYILHASPPRTGPGRNFYTDVAGSYYPNAADPSNSMPVTLRWGQETQAIDIEIPDRLTYFLTGIARDAKSGGPCAGCAIKVMRLDGEFTITLPLSVAASNSGMFVIRGLAAGDYKIVAVHTSDRDLVAQRVVKVDERTADEIMNLNVGESQSVSGRIVLEGEPENGNLQETILSLDPEDTPASWPAPEVMAGPDGTFQFPAVAPGTYTIEAGPLPPGTYLKAVRVGRMELSAPRITVEPGTSVGNFELILAHDGAALNGVVETAKQNRSVPNPTRARVFLFPETGQSGLLTVRSTETDYNGVFSLATVAPGDYVLFALPAASALDVHDPAVHAALRREATALRLRPDERAGIAVRMSELPQ